MIVYKSLEDLIRRDIAECSNEPYQYLGIKKDKHLIYRMADLAVLWCEETTDIDRPDAFLCNGYVLIHAMI